MRQKLTLALLALMALAIGSQDQDIFFQDGEKSIILRDFVGKSISYTPGQLVRFSGTGSPLTADVRSNGLLLQGNEIQGVAKPIASLFYLEEANLSGSAVAIMDSKVREDFELSKKLRTAPGPEQSRTRIDSARMVYAGTQEEGELTMPAKLRVRSDTTGARTVKKEDKDVAQTYTQALDLVGTSGAISLDPNAKTSSTNLKKGTIQGPVEFTFLRSETDAGAKEPAITNLVGRGDKLIFDFTGTARTITLVGNVHLVGTGSFNGETNVDKLIITVDEKLQPIRYETEGNPSTTKMKTGDGGK